MKSYLLTAIFTCGALFSENAEYQRIAAPIAPRNIQVLLERDASEALLEVKGPYTLFNPHDGSKIASGILGKRFIVRETETGLKWGEEFPGIHQIYILPRGSDSSIFVNGIQYSGAVAVFGVAGMVNIVNDIDIELYVKSTLATEFPSPLEPEVMSALAILARTDAYFHATKNRNSFWHVAASENQYSGSALIVANSPAERATETTRHLILVHPNEGKHSPFPAKWTENSAGKTARYEAIFRLDAETSDKGVEAPHAALARLDSKWTYQVSKKNLSKLLDTAQIQSVEVFVDQSSGKSYGLRIKDSDETHDVDFFTLQEKLGKNHILSSDFTVSLKDDAVLFTGYGKGHGVGLCLYSASSLAQNGENAVKILAKFFPETYLYNIDALPDGVVK